MKEFNRRLNFFIQVLFTSHFKHGLPLELRYACLNTSLTERWRSRKRGPNYELPDFNQGLTDAEIVGFLVLRHGIACSVRTLKRILKPLGLKRAGHNNESVIEHIMGRCYSGRTGEFSQVAPSWDIVNWQGNWDVTMIWKWEEILWLGFACSNFPKKNKRLLAV